MKGQAKWTDVGIWGAIIMAKLSSGWESWVYLIFAFFMFVWGIIIQD